MSVSKFWKPWEGTVRSWTKIHRILSEIHTRWPNRVFAWRGLVNADWPLHSSLYRRLIWTRSGTASPPDEAKLLSEEKKILARVHQWGLHHGRFGRLSILHQLALLQHYGAPTRLIDVTFNPYIGLWFAVEQKWQNAAEVQADKDARLYAIDVTDRLINENNALRKWEDSLLVPWSNLDQEVHHEWRSKTFAWKPPHIEARLAAQNGGFLLGGVPYSGTQDAPIQWTKKVNGGGYWGIRTVRRITSVSLRRHKLPRDGGTVADNAVFSIRIKASAKASIRERLERQFGYTHSVMYPDFTGFSSFGAPHLRESPPA